MNINSPQVHFDQLQTFLANCLIDFQILGITESRLNKGNPPTTNIMLSGFTYEHMPTKLPMEALYYT